MAGRPWRRAITRYAELVRGNPAAPGEWNRLLWSLHRHYPYARPNSAKMLPWDFVLAHQSQLRKLVYGKLPQEHYSPDVRELAQQELELELASAFAVYDDHGNLVGYKEATAEEWLAKAKEIALSPVIGFSDEGRARRERGKGLLADIRRTERARGDLDKRLRGREPGQSPLSDARHHPFAPKGSLEMARSADERLDATVDTEHVWHYILYEASPRDREIIALYYASLLYAALDAQEAAIESLEEEAERRAGGAIEEISQKEAENITLGLSDFAPEDVWHHVDPETQTDRWYRRSGGPEGDGQGLRQMHALMARLDGMVEASKKMRSLLDGLTRTIVRVNERAGKKATLPILGTSRDGEDEDRMGWKEEHILTAFPTYNAVALRSAQGPMQESARRKGIRPAVEANPRREGPFPRSSRRSSSRSPRRPRVARR